jgi:NAD-dependent dihydropyrimidine dehydrogenase PreA subunit
MSAETVAGKTLLGGLMVTLSGSGDLLAMNPRSNMYEEMVPSMTYVIVSPCVGLKDGSCVDVCPVDCIHPAAGESDYENVQQLFINPDECIDCGACEPACPVSAIFEESAVPTNEKQYIQINADYFRNR